MRRISRDAFPRTLRGELIKEADRTSEAVLKLYGDTLLQSDLLEEKADEVVRLLFTGILAREEPGGLIWIQQALTQRQGILKGCESATQTVFRDRVKETLREKEPSEAVRVHIEEIARALGIVEKVAGEGDEAKNGEKGPERTSS